MGRNNLIRARREAGLSQIELAQKLQVRQATVSSWETGQADPDPIQIPRIRGILDSSDSQLFDIDIQGSVKGLRYIMEMLRRQFLDWLAKVGGTAALGSVSLALVSSPVVEPDEYLPQAQVAISECWDNLNRGAFDKVERALSVHMPTLKRLATTISPYQSVAASLGVQACVLGIVLATRNANFLERESHCIEAVKFGTLSDNRDLSALALDWQANTYTVCYKQPQRAIPLLNSALSLNSESTLINSVIYSNLSLAYSQDSTQDDYENKARDYMEQAHVLMPDNPALDPLYHQHPCTHASLEAIEAKMYLHLAESIPGGNYAQMAYDACMNAINLSNDTVNTTHCSAFIRKADALRAMGQMRDFAGNLEQGLLIAVQIGNQRRIKDAHAVLHRIPEKWQREDKVITLQKDLTHALVSLN